MRKKTQTLHFENAEKDRTATIQIVLENKLGTFPLSYQMVLHQETSTIFCSQQKWDAWKSRKGSEQQMKFLHRHVWTYEPGKLPARYQEKLDKIFLLHLEPVKKKARADGISAQWCVFDEA